MTSTDEPLLTVEHLKKYFPRDRSIIDILRRKQVSKVQAVDDVSFDLSPNEVKGVIGESGCGKTTLLMTLLGLMDKTSGTVKFRGKSYDDFGRKDWREFRRNVQVIFQDPFNSLDPKMTVRQTLRVPLDVHDITDNEEQHILDTLERVELRPPERFIDEYPDQLSGGEKQRVAIARALVLEPKVILADEPVSMLDVSTQAVILKLLSRLIEEEDLAMIYISHDLSTVSYICDEINVMYLGRIVETAPTMEILDDPKHPYAQELINAIPALNPHRDRDRTRLSGSTPDPINLGEGCRFRDRCPDRMDVCEATPEKIQLTEEHEAACHLYYDHDVYESEGRIRRTEPAQRKAETGEPVPDEETTIGEQS